MSERSSSDTGVAAAPRRRLGVILIDPLPVVRAGIGLLIDGQQDLELLAQAGDARQGLSLIERARRTRVVVLISVSLAGERDAGWLIRTCRERFPWLGILAMGANAEAATVSHALFVGADGFVDKGVDVEEFLSCIRRAAAGEMILAGPVHDEIGRIAEGIVRRRDLDVTLTERERQVLVVAAEGLTAREIAARLGVRERTVTTHLARIYGKLGVGSRLAAIRAASRSGLVSMGLPD